MPPTTCRLLLAAPSPPTRSRPRARAFRSLREHVEERQSAVGRALAAWGGNRRRLRRGRWRPLRHGLGLGGPARRDVPSPTTHVAMGDWVGAPNVLRWSIEVLETRSFHRECGRYPTHFGDAGPLPIEITSDLRRIRTSVGDLDRSWPWPHRVWIWRTFANAFRIWRGVERFLEGLRPWPEFDQLGHGSGQRDNVGRVWL